MPDEQMDAEVKALAAGITRGLHGQNRGVAVLALLMVVGLEGRRAVEQSSEPDETRDALLQAIDVAQSWVAGFPVRTADGVPVVHSAAGRVM